MTPLDIGLLTALGGFVLAGFWFGVIHMIGGLIGALLGAVIAGKFYAGLAAVITPWIGGNANLARLIAFMFIFLLVGRLVGFVFNLIEKVFNVIAIIPFLKTFNRLLGAAFGLLEGTLVLGLAIHFASKFPISGAFEIMLRESQVARSLNLVGVALAPLLPKAVRAIRSVFS